MDESRRLVFCRVAFLTLECAPAETFIVPFPVRDRALLKEIIGRHLEDDAVREQLIEAGVRESILEPDRPRLCWFIHTGRSLRELLPRRKHYECKNVGELLDMAENDDRAVVGCGQLEAVAFNELTQLLLLHEEAPRLSAVDVRDPVGQHAQGTIDMEQPYVIVRIARDAASQERASSSGPGLPLEDEEAEHASSESFPPQIH